MKLQEELNYLKGYIKLSERDAVRRDLLEGFLSDRNKCLLLDADSILFKVAHYNQNGHYFDEMYEQYHDQVREIVNTIEEDGFVIDNVIHFFSTCSKNFRYKIDPTYKANREKTPLTEIVKHFKWYVISVLEVEGEIVNYSDTLEADDLIAEAVEVLDDYGTIVASIDKDLKQIPTCHFDYYKKKIGEDEQGNVLTDFRGFEYASHIDGRDLFFKQLLIGDSSDGIKGVYGLGKKKSDKIISGKSKIEQIKELLKAYKDKERLRKNIHLMQLYPYISVKEVKPSGGG